MRTTLAFAAVALSVSALPAYSDVEDRQKTERTFQLGGGSRKLIVDGINDRIDVTGYNGNVVEVVVNERWRADSADYLAEAKRDVRLDMTQTGNEVKLYVDGPFRDRDRNVNYHGRQHYDVSFEFQIRVPVDAALDLRTVNGGSVNVNNSDADFDIRNVNGGIELREMGGSGSATTVNGSVRVAFKRNPTKDCTFKTVNGAIDTEFLAGLSADIETKTFNGQAYTDFDVTALPAVMPATEQHGTKNVYRTDRWTHVRAGSGGPHFKFDTLNGTIRITNRNK